MAFRQFPTKTDGHKAAARNWAKAGLSTRDHEGPVDQYRRDLAAILDGTF